MRASPTVVAHLIVGAKPEPYLSAVLASIAGVCDHAVVNDNSGVGDGPSATVITRSALARAGRLTHLRTRFTDFAGARNACIEATPAPFRQGWVLFVDADEVHGPDLAPMRRLLVSLPSDIEAVDGYSRHFIGSFSWWRSVERRLCFFRLSEERRWHGTVHEALEPLGARIVLPVVWCHYGYVIEPHIEWERGRLYRSLGQPDPAVDDELIARATVELVWGEKLREAIRYRGPHPPAAHPTIARLTQLWRDRFAQVDAVAARQSAYERLRNALRAANYARLVAWRRFEARLRWRWPDEADDEK